ncbi:MAG: hypothetical protein ACKVJF_11995 [Flavobacteriales bacterium]
MFDPFKDNGVGREIDDTQLLALLQASEDAGLRSYKGKHVVFKHHHF